VIPGREVHPDHLGDTQGPVKSGAEQFVAREFVEKIRNALQRLQASPAEDADLRPGREQSLAICSV